MADIDLGFSEFIAKLISETFTAVAEAALEQERRFGQLAASAALTLDEFVETFVAPEDVDAALLESFPPPAEGFGDTSRSAAAEGQPYQAAGDDSSESPPLAAVLGIAVERGDITRAGRISSRLAARVREEMGMRLGRSEWELARAVVRRGVPRVIVDSGHIMAKQTYNLTSTADAAQPVAPGSLPAPRPTGPRPAAPTVRLPERLELARPLPFRTDVLGRLLVPTIRPDLLLRVTTPQASGPVAQGDIYGEVEVTFKTVP